MIPWTIAAPRIPKTTERMVDPATKRRWRPFSPAQAYGHFFKAASDGAPFLEEEEENDQTEDRHQNDLGHSRPGTHD